VSDVAALKLLAHEAESMLARLELLRPFSEHMPMVPAATVGFEALRSIEKGLLERYARVRARIREFGAWLRAGPKPPDEAQRQLARVRLLFGGLLSEFDLFADVITQRSEHPTGLLLSGIDVAAIDMMRCPAFEAPAVISYLDRGHGAAIRRAMTRLPAGGDNPVAVLRVPRERMIGTGLAGSIAHEVGHQAASLLDLVPALQEALRARSKKQPERAVAFRHFDQWSSEILADLWAVGAVGVAHTLGLFALLNLPTPHVFLGGLDRVHPIPWIRVHISAALGEALVPHPQWKQLRAQWSALHPLASARPEKQALMKTLLEALPEFAALACTLRPRSLEGKRIADLFPDGVMHPARLAETYERWKRGRLAMYAARPSLVFAVLGQARADGKLPPKLETRVLETLILRWATEKLRLPEGSAAASA